MTPAPHLNEPRYGLDASISSGGIGRLGFLLAAAAVVAMSFVLQYPRAKAAFDSHRVFLAGPDDYLRLYRAEQIARGEATRIRWMKEINAPRGAELHWTAPMDDLLAGADWLLGRWATGPDGFAAIAAWVPPCLGALYLLVMIGFVGRGCGHAVGILAGLLVAVSPAFYRVFCVAHPDHHCLIELLLLVTVAGWMPPRLSRDRPRNAEPDGPADAAKPPSAQSSAQTAPQTPAAPVRLGGALISGLAMGLAIWVASQALIVWLAMMAGLAYACCTGPIDHRRAYAEARLVWNCVVAIVVLTGCLIENWPKPYPMAVDKISLVHVALAAIAFLAPSATGRRRARRRPTARGEPSLPRTDADASPSVTSFVAFLAAVAAFTVWLAASSSRAFEPFSRPEFFRWSQNVMELRPLIVQAGTAWSLKPLHSLLGLLPYALPVLLIAFVRSKSVPKPIKCALFLLAPAVTLLSIRQLRWLDHVNLAVVPVAVIGACELGRLLFRRDTTSAAAARLALATVVLAALVFPSASKALDLSVDRAMEANAFQQRTDFVAQQIRRYEAKHPAADPARRAILCEDGEGPALLYWTGLPVVATPYHRALDGLLEAARFFAERDPAQARAQLDRLGVRYVVMPPRAHEQLMQLEQIAFGELRSFDPPTDTLDDFGRLVRKLNYKPHETAQTMAYRLVMEPSVEVIPGVERVAEILEGATALDGTPMKTGLLYVVHDLPADSRPATAPPSAP